MLAREHKPLSKNKTEPPPPPSPPPSNSTNDTAPSPSPTHSPPPPPTSVSPPPPTFVSPPSPPSPTQPPPSPLSPTQSPLSPPSTTVPPPPSSTTAPPPPPPPSTQASSQRISKGEVALMAIGGVVVLVAVGLVLFVIVNRKNKKKRTLRFAEPQDLYYVVPPHPPSKGGRQGHWWLNPSLPPPVGSRPTYPADHFPAPPPLLGSSGGSDNPHYPPPSPSMALVSSRSMFTYEELARATNGFSDANLIGEGGFGYVHKGVLPNGTEVAVKQLKSGSGQGEREFQAEVEIISRVHHKHLVTLVGYCITGSQRLLVYEFVPNYTMEFHLHGKGRPIMDWTTRLKIALGSAKGLKYLHEDCQPKIIHRDIKAANILLDYNFEAKVADFGLAKFCSDVYTHVSTRVMGTFGYLAPEYASSGKLTDKSDVYSFGIVLLELITGRRPVDPTQSFTDDSLVDWAMSLLSRASEDGNFDGLVDPKLQNNYDHDEMARMAACAAACVRHSAKHRPRMSQVVRALEGAVSVSNLNERIEPGQSRSQQSVGGSDNDSIQ